MTSFPIAEFRPGGAFNSQPSYRRAQMIEGPAGRTLLTPIVILCDLRPLGRTGPCVLARIVADRAVRWIEATRVHDTPAPAGAYRSNVVGLADYRP